MPSLEQRVRLLEKQVPALEKRIPVAIGWGGEDIPGWSKGFDSFSPNPKKPGYFAIAVAHGKHVDNEVLCREAVLLTAAQLSRARKPRRSKRKAVGKPSR